MITLSPTDKHTIDAVSVFTVVSTYIAEKVGLMTENLPTVALVLTILWTLIRIWETNTVQKLFGRKLDGEKTDND